MNAVLTKQRRKKIVKEMPTIMGVTVVLAAIMKAKTWKKKFEEETCPIKVKKVICSAKACSEIKAERQRKQRRQSINRFVSERKKNEHKQGYKKKKKTKKETKQKTNRDLEKSRVSQNLPLEDQKELEQVKSEVTQIKKELELNLQEKEQIRRKV